MSGFIIRGCQLDAESGGIVIEYVTPADDVKANGMVLNHALLIPPLDRFLPLLDDIDMVLQRALTEALVEFETAGPVDVEEQLDVPSPYDNPDER